MQTSGSYFAPFVLHDDCFKQKPMKDGLSLASMQHFEFQSPIVLWVISFWKNLQQNS
jgi:hypothetical protein